MLRTALRYNKVYTANADVNTTASLQVSSPGSVYELVFTLVAQVVRSWMKGLGVHHRHRDQGPKKGTPVPLSTYCLNIDNTEVLKVWVVTTFACST